MNHEIKFCGKRLDNGEWVCGSLISFDNGEKAILPSGAKVFRQRGTTTICCNECYDVDPSTVSVDTNLTPEEVMGLIAPNDPLTLEELREMAWNQCVVWCDDADGCHTGLLCIRDDWFSPERTPHIWLLDEEGNCGLYSVDSLLKCRAKFYRRRPEEDAHGMD